MQPRSTMNLVIRDGAVRILENLLAVTDGEIPTNLGTMKTLGLDLGLSLKPIDANHPDRPAILVADPHWCADFIHDARGGGQVRWDAALLPSGQAIMLWHEYAEYVARDRGDRGLFDYEDEIRFTGRPASRRNVHHRTAIAVEDLLIAELKRRGIDTRIMERIRREKRRR